MTLVAESAPQTEMGQTPTAGSTAGRDTTSVSSGSNSVTARSPGGDPSSSNAVRQRQDLQLPAPPVPAASEDDSDSLFPTIPTSLADLAPYIPGFDLLTLVIGANPLTGEPVEPTAENILGGLVGLAPGGALVYGALCDMGIVERGLAHVLGQLDAFGLDLGRFERVATETLDEIADLELGLDIIDKAIAIVRSNFGQLVDDVLGFVGSLIAGIIDLVKEAAVDFAAAIVDGSPTWEVLKKIIHYDPLTGEPVEAPTAEILAEVLIVLGKQTELEQMQARGTLERTAQWLDTQFATFASLRDELVGLVVAVWEAIAPDNLLNLAGDLEALTGRALGFFSRVVEFGWTLATTVLAFIKDALLGWLSSVANHTPGFHLLTVILEKDPFTGEAVARTPENLIRGFITLLPGGETIYTQLSEAGVIAEAGGNIEAALESLGITWDLIRSTFLGVWETLTLEALIEPLETFASIVARFGEPLARIFEFIRVVVTEVFKLIVALTGFPADMIARIVTNALQAYEDIVNDPVQFFINMLEALKAGFVGFFDNFLTHIVGGLVDWLLGAVADAGLTPPADFSLGSILDFVFEVFGVTMERLWEKLADRIGQERVDQIRDGLDRLTGVFGFIRDVTEQGPAAIWSYIEGQISGLWSLVLTSATEWIMQKVIIKVTTWLLGLLDPTGIMAVVNSCIAIYKAIESAAQYMYEMLEILDRYVATLAAVAKGQIEPGAAMIEGGLAAAIPVAIGFLANQLGLGNLGEKIGEIVEGIRELVDKAIDWLMDQVFAALSSLASMLGLGPAAAGETASTDEEPSDVDVTDHGVVAAAVLAQLRSIDADDLEEMRAQATAKAGELEEQYTPLLEDGIGLFVRFEDGQSEAGGLHVIVTIAPNTTKVEEDLPLEDDRWSDWFELHAALYAEYLQWLELAADPSRLADQVVGDRRSQTVALRSGEPAEPARVAGGATQMLDEAQLHTISILGLQPVLGQQGDHAELQLLLESLGGPGLSDWVFSSNNFCELCREMIERTGGQIVPPLRGHYEADGRPKAKLAIFASQLQQEDVMQSVVVRLLEMIAELEAQIDGKGLTLIDGIGAARAEKLKSAGIESNQALTTADEAQRKRLGDLQGLSVKMVEGFVEQAKQLAAGEPASDKRQRVEEKAIELRDRAIELGEQVWQLLVGRG